MFTGIVEEIGVLLNKRASDAGLELEIKADSFLREIKTGDSIMVNGICLTVTKILANGFAVFASPETITATRMSNQAVGSSVHLERAMRADSRLDGHIVTGHVDGLGKVVELQQQGKSLFMRIQIPAELKSGVVAKGSISLDGVSLTVNEVGQDSFSLMIIPETLKRTYLGKMKIGDMVNIELDIIGKYVQASVAHYLGGSNLAVSQSKKKEQNKPISENLLRNMGF